MKKSLTLYLLLFTANSFGQTANSNDVNTTNINKHGKSEVSLQYSFGFSDRNFQTPKNTMFERLDYSHARSYYDRGFTLRYNYAVIQKGKNRLLLGAGVGYANSQHYQCFADMESNYLLEAVVFDSKAVSIPLTVSYERALISNQLFLELSYSLNYNMPLEKTKVYESEQPGKQDFINYTYSMEVRNRNSRSHYLALTPKLKLINHLFLNCSIGYLTSKKLNYNYEYHTNYTRLDLNTGKSISYNSSVNSIADIEIVDKYLYLSVGLAYKF